MLFDHFERTNGNPAEYGEPLFTFFNRAAGEHWQSVRDLLSDWVSAYPVEERPALISRFRRTDRRGFLGAFWELYLHELFRRLDFDIELHPAIEDVTHRPDFLLRKGGASTYVEATTIFEPQAHSTDDARLAPVLDAINRIDSPNFALSVNARQIARSALPLTQLTQELACWLAAIERDSSTHSSRSDPKTFKWQERGWSLFFHAIPRGDGARLSTSAPTVGNGPLRARFDDDARAVRMRLSGKTRYYGRNLDAPYLIALASYRPGHSPGAVLTGLFGPASARHDLIAIAGSQTTSSNRGEGFWLTSRGVRYQDASAVLTTFELMPWTVARSQPWLIENPWATRPLEIEPPFNRFDIDASSGEITNVESGFQPGEHFGLVVDWPSGVRLSNTSDEVSSR